jgi:hypothetical protein
MTNRSRILKPALIAVACLAIGAGAAPAASLISGSTIKKGTISASKLTPSALKSLQTPKNIKSQQISDGTLLLGDLSQSARDQLVSTAGSTAPNSTTGPQLYSVFVTAEGVVGGGFGFKKFSRREVTGGFLGSNKLVWSQVQFNRDVSKCTRVASVGYAAEGPDDVPSTQASGMVTKLANGAPDTVEVTPGPNTFAPFHLIVLCPPA